jgi:hypothetical protein
MLHDKDYASRNAALCSTHISITSLEVTLPFLEGNSVISQRKSKHYKPQYKSVFFLGIWRG